MSRAYHPASAHGAEREPQDVAPAGQAAPLKSGFGSRGWSLAAGLALFLLTLLVYSPVRDAGFIWDDDVMLTGNRQVQSPDGLKAIWFSTELADYFPLTSTALWLQWRLWGPDPLGYHVVNVLLHATAALLWWRVFARLRLPGAWFAAALFALHPVNVESVAWITEIKNTLAMVFLALTAWAFVRWDEKPASIGWYALALLAFAGSLLSKTAVVPVPVVMLAYVWWRHGRISRRDAAATVPFFAAAAVLAVVTLWFHEHRALGGMVVRDDGALARVAGAGWAVWFYLGKLLVPANLAFVYPRWVIDPGNPLVYLPLLALIGLLFGVWRMRGRIGRGPLFAVLWFVVLLLPVLGFVNISYMRHSFVADRWQYFALVVPIAALVAVAATKITSRLARVAAAAGLLIVAGGLTARQAETYDSVDTLWRATLARNPDAAVAHSEVGNGFLERGQTDQAIEHYEAALRVQPDYGLAHHNYGCALLRKGRTAEAVERFRLAIRHHPALQPAYLYLGRTLLQEGATDEAASHLERAVALQPDLAEARYHLASARLQQGRLDDAVAQFRAAVAHDPGSAQAHNDLGVALIQTGNAPEAREHFGRAVELAPDFSSARNNLARMLQQEGRFADAVVQFRAALKTEPENVDTLTNLAWVLATATDDKVRSGMQAIVYAQRANQQTGHENPFPLRALAAGYAEIGRFSDAVASLERALGIAERAGDAGLSQMLRGELNIVGSGSPLREGPLPGLPQP